MAGLLDFFQGASNAAASNISAPVDGLAWLLKQAGMNIENPVGGSDWMKQKGLTAEPENKWAGLLGESVGGLAPILASAKAAQIAKLALQAGDNLAAPQALNKQTGAVFIYPQDKALATAQRNAAKSIDEGGLGLLANNTPAQRAQAMGFTDDAYHGTNADIRAFNPALADSRRKTGTPAGAVVTSSNPASASTYAGQATDGSGNISAYADGGNVIPLALRKQSSLSATAKGANWNDLYLPKFSDVESVNDFAAIAAAKGKQQATIKNVRDNATWSKQNGIDSRIGDTTFLFDPTAIRSRFAVFDPARRNEADILGKADPDLLSWMAGAGLFGYGGYSALKD